MKMLIAVAMSLYLIPALLKAQPSDPFEPPPAGEGVPVGTILTGKGTVKSNNDALSRDWSPKAGQANVKVSGNFPVTGGGVSGKTKVKGNIKVVLGEWNHSKDRISVKGCGKVQGSSEIKDAHGRKVGKVLVSGEACVAGYLYHGWCRSGPGRGGNPSDQCWRPGVEGAVEVSGQLP